MSIYINNFSTRVVEKSKNDKFFSFEGKTLLDVKSDLGLFKSKPKFILADPFLFVHNEELFLFYEHQDCWFGKGRLCMRKTADLKSWSDEIDVLIEPFHLSFPNVFEENGHVYMIPETGADKSVRLYEAENDSLTKWRLVKKLIEFDVPRYDTCVYKKDGVYYMWNSFDDEIDQILYLYTSDSLFGPYTEHPCSPVCRGRDCGRNAGSIVVRDGKIYRPAQGCVGGYGEQTSIFEITELTPTSYKEEQKFKNIVDKGKFKLGGHQFNYVEFKGKIIVTFDYREANYNLIEFFRRVIDKLFHVQLK